MAINVETFEIPEEISIEVNAKIEEETDYDVHVLLITGSYNFVHGFIEQVNRKIEVDSKWIDFLTTAQVKSLKIGVVREEFDDKLRELGIKNLTELKKYIQEYQSNNDIDNTSTKSSTKSSVKSSSSLKTPTKTQTKKPSKKDETKVPPPAPKKPSKQQPKQPQKVQKKQKVVSEDLEGETISDIDEYEVSSVQSLRVTPVKKKPVKVTEDEDDTTIDTEDLFDDVIKEESESDGDDGDDANDAKSKTSVKSAKVTKPTPKAPTKTPTKKPSKKDETKIKTEKFGTEVIDREDFDDEDEYQEALKESFYDYLRTFKDKGDIPTKSDILERFEPLSPEITCVELCGPKMNMTLRGIIRKLK